MSVEKPSQWNSKRLILLLLAGLVFVVYTFQEYFLTQKYQIPEYYTQNKTIVLSESELVPSNSTPSTGVRMHNSVYGLGNQLFNYAECYALSRNLKLPLIIPLTKDSNKADWKNSSYRAFAMNHLSLPKGTYIPKKQMNKFKKVYPATCQMARNASLIPQEVLNNTKYFSIKSWCFSGSSFSEFEDELKEIRVNLEKPSEGYLRWRDEIRSWEWPVGVHVRRGDIRKQYWSAPIDYFKNAMRRMKKDAPRGLKLAFFVFSDEINWAREGLVGEGFFLEELGVPVFFVSGSFGGLTNLEDFDLMTKCKSIVISNSTFSWWAAYLIKDGKNKKIVIRPKFNPKKHKNEVGWKGKKNHEYAIGYPQEWIQMEA